MLNDLYATVAKMLIAQREGDERREDDLISTLNAMWRRLSPEEKAASKVVTRQLGAGTISEAEFIRRYLPTMIATNVGPHAKLPKATTDHFVLLTHIYSAPQRIKQPFIIGDSTRTATSGAARKSIEWDQRAEMA